MPDRGPLACRPWQFDPKKDLLFDYGPALPGHANGMILKATDAQGDVILQETYYSIGGGFVLTATEQAEAGSAKARTRADVPYPFETADEMLEMAKAKSGLTIAQMKLANELKFRTKAEIDKGIARLWEVMNACISRGMEGTGHPAGRAESAPPRQGHPRRADGRTRAEHDRAAHDQRLDEPLCHGGERRKRRRGAGRDRAHQWRGGGASRHVLRYYLDHVPGATPSKIPDFLLTAAAIGGLCKHNASISGAECGCQAEVGSAAAMSAAGPVRGDGRHVMQVENAAEIALEHHLGMTCDPVKGLVQVPCIERNGLGAIKAVSAASLALRGDGVHLVSLDACIETMRQTGQDMHEKYKETSLGGLAVNVPNC